MINLRTLIVGGATLWGGADADAAAPPKLPVSPSNVREQELCPSPWVRPYFGLRLTQRDSKVVIANVDPLGLARGIGLKYGDVLTRFQGRPVVKVDDFLDALARL